MHRDPPRARLGAFDVIAPLGDGGMGLVWRGVHRAFGVPVAVKVLRDSVDRAVLANEVRAMARLRHPNVLAILDHGEVGDGWADVPRGAPYLVTELASGGTIDPAAASRRGTRSARCFSTCSPPSRTPTRAGWCTAI